MVGSIRVLLLAAVAFVLAATAAQAQLPPSPLPSPGKPAPAPTDQGNQARQSVGVVQVGPAHVEPTQASGGTVGVATPVAGTPVADPVADTCATTQTTVGYPGTGNGASQSG